MLSRLMAPWWSEKDFSNSASKLFGPGASVSPVQFQSRFVSTQIFMKLRKLTLGELPLGSTAFSEEPRGHPPHCRWPLAVRGPSHIESMAVASACVRQVGDSPGAP